MAFRVVKSIFQPFLPSPIAAASSWDAEGSGKGMGRWRIPVKEDLWAQLWDGMDWDG